MISTDAISGLMNPNNQAKKLKSSNAMSQDDFMKILLTQMKMQTPENPFDSNTMMQQMSQFTNLSATKEMEAAVKTLNSSMAANQMLSASQMIGKKVQVASDICPLVPGEAFQGGVALPQDAEQVTVQISDKFGRVVKTVEMGPSLAGMAEFTWDGKDKDGKALPAGNYSFSATAVMNGQHTAASTFGTYKVSSVSLDPKGNSTNLELEGVGAVSMKDLIKIV